jgi:hypothetical protein
LGKPLDLVHQDSQQSPRFQTAFNFLLEDIWVRQKPRVIGIVQEVEHPDRGLRLKKRQAKARFSRPARTKEKGGVGRFPKNPRKIKKSINHDLKL